MVAPPRIRKIDGKTYTFRDGSRHKTGAEKATKQIKERGIYKNIRIIENPGCSLKWGVYVRRK